MSSVLELSARDAVRALKRGEVSPVELLDAVEQRLSDAEPGVNAVPTVCLDRARRHASRLMSGTAGAEPDDPAWLAGLPVTVKDVIDVAGLPTTFGAKPYATTVATRSDPLVERIERRGAIVIGKTNVPEFLSGADTVNPLFGRTSNPWDATVSCGASSGGAAVSVATREAWCAHGEDTAGSIRIPASFCGVVGLRPTPGLVPTGRYDPIPGFSVHGPLARDADDAALFLAAMLGARPSPAASGRRVAFSADLGGALPVDKEVADICTAAVRRLEERGYDIEEYAPELGGAHEACLALLAHRAWVLHGERVGLGAAIRAEVDAGAALSPERLARAHRARAAFARVIESMFDTYDMFVTATFGLPPWPVKPVGTGPSQRFQSVGAGLSPYPENSVLAKVAAVWPMTTMATMAGCPAVSVPCGRTAAGHPVGLQLIGPPLSDFALLRAARDVEQPC